MLRIALFFALLALLAHPIPSRAKCILPAPDTDVEGLTPANIEGKISGIKNNIVYIRAGKSSSTVAVRLPRGNLIYTAFGGDQDASQLRIGQTAAVWLVGCRRGHSRVPRAAYFQIYSADPNDHP